MIINEREWEELFKLDKLKIFIDMFQEQNPKEIDLAFLIDRGEYEKVIEIIEGYAEKKSIVIKEDPTIQNKVSENKPNFEFKGSTYVLRKFLSYLIIDEIDIPLGVFGGSGSGKEIFHIGYNLSMFG